MEINSLNDPKNNIKNINSTIIPASPSNKSPLNPKLNLGPGPLATKQKELSNEVLYFSINQFSK